MRPRAMPGSVGQPHEGDEGLACEKGRPEAVPKERVDCRRLWAGVTTSEAVVSCGDEGGDRRGHAGGLDGVRPRWDVWLTAEKRERSFEIVLFPPAEGGEASGASAVGPEVEQEEVEALSEQALGKAEQL